MVKFEKNKMKKLNKLEKKQTSPKAVTNKVIKKKINSDKKVAFQNQVLLKETVQDKNLVKVLSKTDVELQNLFKKDKPEPKPKQEGKPKIKAVEKQKKRQKIQMNDTKLLLNLMKKTFKVKED